MLIIDKKYRKILDHARKEVEKRQKQEDALFMSWCTALDINPDSSEGNILFGYLFNGEKFGLRFK